MEGIDIDKQRTSTKRGNKELIVVLEIMLDYMEQKLSNVTTGIVYLF